MNTEAALKFFGLKFNYSDEELNNTYRRMLMQHHPDRGGDVEMFLKAVDAHKQLTGSKTTKILKVTLEELFTGCTKSIDDTSVIIPANCICGSVIDGYLIDLDLPVNISIDKDKSSRDYLRILEDWRISPFVMMVGGFVDKELFDGRTYKVYIPPGAQSHSIVKLKNRGIWKTATECSDYFMRLIPDMKKLSEYTEAELACLKKI